MLTITVNELTGSTCNAHLHTPEPYGEFVFNDAKPASVVTTGVCAATSTVCELSFQIPHVLASWLTDGSTTVDVRDDSKAAIPQGEECWGPTVLTLPAPLPVASPRYTVKVPGYSDPGMTFTLSAE
jgi:hypothetical protein